MDKAITTFLLKKGKWNMAPIDYLLVVGMTVAGIMLRSTMWNAPLENAPYQNMDEMLKLVTAIFDVLMAMMAGCLVLVLTGHQIKAMLAYGVTFVLPTVVVGSAVWGMGDSVYVFILLVSFYFLLSSLTKEFGKRFAISVVLFGLALLLSQNALFLTPLYLIAYLLKEEKGFSALAFVAPVIGFGLHVVLDQGSVSNFGFLAAQGALSEARYELLLSYNYPNIYQMIGPASYIHEYGSAMRVLVLVLLIAVAIFAMRRPYGWDVKRYLGFGLILSMVVPFIMPFMDERAGYLAAVLSVMYGFVCEKQFFVPIIQVTISYLACAAYFRGESFLPLAYIALAQLALIIYMLIVYEKKSHASV